MHKWTSLNKKEINAKVGTLLNLGVSTASGWNQNRPRPFSINNSHWSKYGTEKLPSTKNH